VTVSSIVAEGRRRSILCQGRGSAANSCVCFLLSGTSIDRIKHELLFERFVSGERREQRDVDVDFEPERREEVIQWIYETYGRNHAALTALRAGVELGMTLIDTAEMYGKGAAETVIGEALGDVCDWLFLVSKAYPQNASRKRLTGACEASLQRLGTDRLDFYLLHWRGSVPLGETMEALKAEGMTSTRTHERRHAG
jgi:hypothetical protein